MCREVLSVSGVPGVFYLEKGPDGAEKFSEAGANGNKDLLR